MKLDVDLSELRRCAEQMGAAPVNVTHDLPPLPPLVPIDLRLPEPPARQANDPDPIPARAPTSGD